MLARPRSERRRAAIWLGVVALVALAWASTANAASLTLVDPSPANGASIQTTEDGAKLTFAWSADRTGCTSTSTSIEIRFTGARPFVNTVTGALPTGSTEILFRTSTAPDAFAWSVAMDCTGGVDKELVSETRSFTNLPPDPAPRFAGRYLTNITGASSVFWKLTPKCPAGACDTFLKIPAIPKFLLKYDAAAARYAGSTSKAKATCRLSFFRSIPGGLRGTVTIRVKVTDTRIVGAATEATGLKGAIIYNLKPTKAAKEAGCKKVVTTKPIRFSLS